MTESGACRCEFTGSLGDQVFQCVKCDAYPDQCADGECGCVVSRSPLATGGRILPAMAMVTRPQDWEPTARAIIFGASIRDAQRRMRQ